MGNNSLSASFHVGNNSLTASFHVGKGCGRWIGNAAFYNSQHLVSNTRCHKESRSRSACQQVICCMVSEIVSMTSAHGHSKGSMICSGSCLVQMNIWRNGSYDKENSSGTDAALQLKLVLKIRKRKQYKHNGITHVAKQEDHLTADCSQTKILPWSRCSPSPPPGLQKVNRKNKSTA